MVHEGMGGLEPSQRFSLDTYRILRKTLLIGLVILLLTSCSGISTVSSPAKGTSTTNGQALLTPGSNTAQPAQATSTTTKTSPPSATAISQATKTLASTATSTVTPTEASSSTDSNIKTVFVIMMENHNWSDIVGNSSAPYINQKLLPQASYAQQYFNPPGNHPSEPNYLWLEAGQSFGVKSDEPPAANHQSSTKHLVTLMDKAGITWKSYLEGISGKECPLTGNGLFTPRHNPMLFFDNVTDSNNPKSQYCIDHLRPFSELKSDLQNNKTAQYIFITPNECNNMHNTDGCKTQDPVKNGDEWLAEQIPMIMKSQAYTQGGAIFILWDESENGENPIGMIVLSPFAKGGGYSNTIHYTHSSTLRTIQEIFGITPLLGDAANATDLSDLFSKFP